MCIILEISYILVEDLPKKRKIEKVHLTLVDSPEKSDEVGPKYKQAFLESYKTSQLCSYSNSKFSTMEFLQSHK